MAMESHPPVRFRHLTNRALRMVAPVAFAALLAACTRGNAAREHAGLPSLGAHTLLGQEDHSGVSPAITAPVDTQPRGSSFITFDAGFASNDGTPSDNQGNTWRRIGDPIVYRGYGGRYSVSAYVAVDGRGGNGHEVRLDKRAEPAGEITVPFVEVRNAAKLVDVAVAYPGAGTTVTSGEVTTDGPATLVAFWWGDGPQLRHAVSVGDRFTLLDKLLDLPPGSAVQCAVAYRNTGSAGTYRVTWTNAPVQGAVLWLFAFEGAPPPAGGTGISR